MSVFDEAHADFYDNVENDPDLQGGEEYVYLEEEGLYVAEILSITEGVHDQDPTHNRYGDPFAACQFYIHENRSGTAYVGQQVSVYFALPSKPKFAKWREKKGSKLFKELVACADKVEPKFISTSDLRKAADGTYVAALVGIKVTSREDNKKGVTYYNPGFYVVDHQGNRIESMDQPTAAAWFDTHGRQHDWYNQGARPAPAPTTTTPAKAHDPADTVQPATGGGRDAQIAALLKAGLDPRQFGFPDYSPGPAAPSYTPAQQEQIGKLLVAGLDPRQFGFPDYVA